MESYYLVIVVCLIALAISDLVVGVSNDAVNFLNSALGSKVASKKTILIVATIGIGLGAVSSSGMMEIARKGIFNPELFTFADIMVIFLAVMITDIILLDLFNTFGMPTSTTVSIMFELLGAAFVVACIKILITDASFSMLGDYLNTSNAVLIIAGIFLSVLIAFSIGSLVQYIVRLVFSFDLEKTLKVYGPFFGGVAITTITYFLIIKGMKGSSIMNTGIGEWIHTNVVATLGIMFTFWTIICFALTRFFKVNVLKMVVLAGTFSLAMAFAGNDLVNFIGVPLAGMQSYEIYTASGIAADQMGMAILGTQLQTNTLILVAAGVIMIITLWFSKKAQSVTETEINLARQSVGAERFKPNLLARAIVKSGIRLGNLNDKLLSAKSKARIEARFQKKKLSVEVAKNEPAFDLVRASVNLMTASILIAFATSLKLPLSTTYVSFMVAMGTSLADRAWNRDSAVYRVAGVINVITGWLFTALIAFSVAGTVAIVLYYGGMAAVVSLMVITGFLLVRSQIVHKKLEKKKNSVLNCLMERNTIKQSEVFKESEEQTSKSLYKVRYILADIIGGLATSDQQRIGIAKNEVDSYQKEYDDFSASFYYYLRKIDSENAQEGQFYLHVLNYLQNISQAVSLIGDKVFTHVRNLHNPMEDEKVKELQHLTAEVSQLLKVISDLMGKEKKGNLSYIKDKNNEVLRLIDHLERVQMERVKKEKSSPKNSMLYIAILLEMRDILANFMGLVGLYEEQTSPATPITPNDEVLVEV